MERSSLTPVGNPSEIEAMNMPRPAARAGLAALILGAALTVAGCSSSQFVNTWREPAFSGGPLDSVLVIAPRRIDIRRRVWEDAFVAELGKRGVAATPSYQLFPEHAPDPQGLPTAVLEHRFNGILLAAVTGRRTEKTVVPPIVTQEYEGEQWNPFLSVYEPVYQEESTPGYVERTRVVSYETTLWDLRGSSRMIWWGASESMNPERGADFASDFASYVVKRLTGAKLV